MPTATGRAFDAFARAGLASHPPRRMVHVEVGANDGAWTRSAITRLCSPAAGGPSPASEPHLFVIVEAQQQYASRLRELSHNISSAPSTRCRVDFLAAAAWHYDGNVSFSSTRDHRGAHVGDESTAKTKARTLVPCVDFGGYLKRTLRPSDLVFFK